MFYFPVLPHPGDLLWKVSYTPITGTSKILGDGFHPSEGDTPGPGAPDEEGVHQKIFNKFNIFVSILPQPVFPKSLSMNEEIIYVL